MIVIKEKTEERFLKRLASLKNTEESFRAVHYKFSLLEQGSFNQGGVVNALGEYFEGSYVYIFEDKDIIVISNLITVKMFESTSKILVKGFDIEESSFSSIYELQKSFSILASIGKRKLEKKNEAKLDKEKVDIPKVEVKDTPKVSYIPDADEDLIKTISEKREGRFIG